MNTALSGSLTVTRVDELSAARKAIAAAASASFAPDRVMDIQLVVSELVTNALEHGTDHRADISYGSKGGSFVVTVVSASDNDRPPAATNVESHVPAGRGLRIVETLADVVSIATPGNGVVTIECGFVIDSTA